MAQITVKYGQSWWDVAIQEYGAWEAGVDLALATNSSMTDAPPQQEILRIDHTYDRVLEHHCKARSVSPATDLGETPIRVRVFANTFVPIFE